MGGQKGIASFYEFYAKEVNLTCVTTKSNDPAAGAYEVLNILSDAVSRYINVFYFFTLRKIIRQKKITHLQIEHPYYGWLAILLKAFCGIKLIVHSHNIEGVRFKSIGKPWWRLILFYEKWVHRSADYNFFISKEDREYAIKYFRLNPVKCLIATYGIEWAIPPTKAERYAAKTALQELHRLSPSTYVILFNGTFGYMPNADALRTILNEINPALTVQKEFDYHILICGKSIPEEILSQDFPNVTIVGFVNDISLYFKGADLFLNPVKDGGGIKTKLVEALGYDLFAVSYKNGAIGIPEAATGNKLVIVPDNDVTGFTESIYDVVQRRGNIPADYFQYFYWGNIIKKAVLFIGK